MMCADPRSGETHRFLTSPRNCEVTGVITTHDGRTTRSAGGASKPRSGIVVITKDDGGVVGT